MRKPTLPAAVIAVALLTCTVVSAETIQLTQPNTGSNTVVVKDTADPFANQWITQSADPCTIVDGTSVICVGGATTVDHGWWRVFDLDDDHGLTGQFCVDNIDWAIQSVVGDGLVTVNVYCLDEGMPFLMQHLTLQDSTMLPVADEELTFHNTAVGGCCDTASQDMAVELYGADCNLTGCIQVIIGMNNLGQTAPTYVRAPACGVQEPTDLASIGFPYAHLIMVVHGEDDGGTGGGSGDPCPPDDDGGIDDGGGSDVPATTGVGAVLLLLILLASGAYFLRRRAAR